MAPGSGPDQAAQDLLQLATERFGDLRQAEAKLVLAAPKGEFANCGPSGDFNDPSNDPAKADAWGPERQVRAGLIRWLCTDREAASRVDPKGIQLMGAKLTGPLELSFASVPFPFLLKLCSLTEDSDFTSLSLPALSLMGSRIRSMAADGLDVKGDVFLGGGFLAEGEVRLHDAQIGGSLNCGGGTFRNPGKNALNADRASVKGSLFLRHGFHAEGEVRLLNAQIGGDLNCGGGTFKNPGGKAFDADRASVKGSLFLRNGFQAEGEVRLLNAQIGGDLNCGGGTFKNTPHKDVPGSGKALNAGGVNVMRNVLLSRQTGEKGKEFTAEGEVRLLGAQIGGDLLCAGGRFKNPPQNGVPESGTALYADGLDVRGSVSLRQGFTAEGEVRLAGAQIGGDLNCRGGMFSALNGQGTRVDHHLLLRDVRDAKNAIIDLRNASADALFDHEASWPAEGNLCLDGFRYGRVSYGPREAEARLRWLALQREFTPQPYRQLAKVLRESGDERGARQVLYEMEKLRRTEQSRIWRNRLHNEKLSQSSLVMGWPRYGLARAWGSVLRYTIGYGFRLQCTLYWLIGLTVLGTLLFGFGYMGGSMAPTEREAYACFEEQGWPPRHYQAFNPFIYALENSVPVLKLGQDSAWAPDPGPREQERAGAVNFPPWKWLVRVRPHAWVTPWLLRCYRWLQIVSGWMLATLFVAGVTGVVRKE
jgi:hypothetical protein